MLEFQRDLRKLNAFCLALQVKGDSVDVAGRKLKEVHSQYQEKTKEFDRLYEAFTKTSQVGGGGGRAPPTPLPHGGV